MKNLVKRIFGQHVGLESMTMRDLERMQKGLAKSINKKFKNHKHVHFVKVRPEDISLRLSHGTGLLCKGREVMGSVYSPSLQVSINLPPEETTRKKRDEFDSGDEFVTARREADDAMREYLRGMPPLSVDIYTWAEPRAKRTANLEITDTRIKGLPKDTSVVLPYEQLAQ